jgi:hypothetical protein
MYNIFFLNSLKISFEMPQFVICLQKNVPHFTQIAFGESK